MADSDWADWDPLTEDYNDKSRNSYDTGAGANMPLELQSPNSSGRERTNGYTLWIRPLESRYTEESLRNIFVYHGTVTDVRIVYPKSGGSPFGYVTYKTQASATAAIRAFNDNDKFEFKVNYAKDPSNVRKNDRGPRNYNQSNNSKFDNDSNRKNPDTSPRDEEKNVSITCNEPFEFRSSASKTNFNRDSNNCTPRDNAKFHPRPPSKELSADFNNSTTEDNFERITEKFRRDNAEHRTRPPSKEFSNGYNGSSTKTYIERDTNNIRSRENAENRPSRSSKEFCNDYNSSEAKINIERDRNNFRARDNAENCPHPPSVTPVSSSSCTLNRNVTEEMELKNFVIKKDPESKSTRTYVKPMQCSHCSKNTFSTCEECGKSFCHFECSLDGWRNHTSSECVQIANVIRSDTLNAPAIPSPAAAIKPVSAVVTPTAVNASVKSERDMSLNNGNVRKYASDHSSPATEYRNFSNLAQDYIVNGNKSLEDASSPPLPKLNAVCDNNYDDNVIAANTSIGDQQPEQDTSLTHFQSRRSDFQRHDKDGFNNQERGGGRNFRNRDDRRDQERGAGSDRGQGGSFKSRSDNRDGSSDHQRRSFDGGRDSRGGDYERSSGSGRGGRDRNRDGDRRQYESTDGTSENERGAGGRNYQRDSNSRDGRGGFDRRKNFNDRNDGKPSDEVDKGSNFGGASQPRNDFSDSRVGYQRNTAQSRIDGVGSNADAGRPNYSLNENRDNSRRQSDLVSERKGLPLNQILQVTIASVEDSGMCHVRLADNEGTFQHVLKVGNEVPLKPLENVNRMTKCMALLKNKWYRALILTEEPLRVRYVDTGDIKIIDPQNIRNVPEQLSQYPVFAIRTKLLKISRDELSRWQIENKVISIKATDHNKDDRYYVAEVIPFEEQLVDVRKDNHGDSRRSSTVSAPTLPSPAPSTSTQPQPEVATQRSPQLRSKQPVEVIVTYKANEKEFYVGFLQPINDINSKLAEEDVNELSPMVDIQEGELALTQYLGDWSRVKIICSDPLKVSFIDYGNVENCEARTLKILPSSYTNIPPMATRVKLHTGTALENNIEENAQIKITPITKENDSTWLVLVGDKSAECESILQQMNSSFVPSCSSTHVQPAPRVALEMLITYVESRRLVYGVPKNDLASLNRLTNMEADFEQATTLELNRIYVKKYDGMWCRARLVNIDPIEIYFIDYGNSEMCHKEEIYELTEELRTDPPPLAKKMVLENESRQVLEFNAVVGVSWDPNRDTYLLTADPTDPGSSNASSNRTVNVVSALGDSNYAVMLEDNRTVYKYIYQNINTNVDRLERPNKVDINDLCLATYEDDMWHRAKVVRKSPLSVYFLDFANETPYDFHQLRKIPPEVAKIPPLAFKIKTEDYVELEEGSEVKITLLEELDHNHWKVATIKEKKREVGSNKRIEIISDPKHIGQCTKKKAKASTSAIHPAPVLPPEDVIVIDDEDDDDVIEVGSYQENVPVENGTGVGGSKKVLSRGRGLVKPFDETSLVLTRLSHVPKNNIRNANTLTNGIDHLSLVEPKRNSTFYDINVPITEHLLDMLHCGDNCILIIYESLCDDEYVGMLLCKRLESLVDTLDHIEDAVNTTEKFSAKKGDLVVTFVRGVNNWHRGYVVYEPSNVDPYYQLILVDSGRLYKADEVFRLNEEYRQVPQLAVRINVTYFQPVPDDIARLEVVPMNIKLIEGDTYQHDKSIYRVQLKENIEDGFSATLSSQFLKMNISHEINLTKWRPTREEIGLKHVPVMTGDLVKIGSICETNKCYVIPVDDAINEQRLEFLSKVAIHSKHAKSIENELKINEIVGVPHAKSYYRAQVIERIKNAYMVRILDTGEKIKVHKTDIKPLTDPLKFADCYAIRVQLHNVPVTDFNQMAAQIVKYVVTRECCFTLDINPSTRLIELKFNDEVERLEMGKGSSFNDYLSGHLQPLWRCEELDFHARFFLKQMKFEEWSIDSELSLYFAESVDENSGLMINRYGPTYANIVRVNLFKRLKEYAEETIERSYVPVKEELCVAKYEDNWHRAFCLHAQPGKDLTLQFLDIGIVVDKPHTDIRRMHSDFLKHPAAAVFCSVVNYMDCKCLHELKGRVLKKCRVLRKNGYDGYDIQIGNLSAYQ